MQGNKPYTRLQAVTGRRKWKTRRHQELADRRGWQTHACGNMPLSGRRGGTVAVSATGTEAERIARNTRGLLAGCISSPWMSQGIQAAPGRAMLDQTKRMLFRVTRSREKGQALTIHGQPGHTPARVAPC
ncbi:hypothetical protein NUK34_03095 [Kerstersia gyiorum]|uniref:hypothetical protein n=1 Tax=Kerstersia gyiorum TaxID=206506 RepID=UPI00215020D8|nr:hypothetical protein [Kerstersia gyiorum]MCR4157844.1 hypothetical protein [Kerstersia gyiorum]